jgi:hypothetical protein
MCSLCRRLPLCLCSLCRRLSLSLCLGLSVSLSVSLLVSALESPFASIYVSPDTNHASRDTESLFASMSNTMFLCGIPASDPRTHTNNARISTQTTRAYIYIYIYPHKQRVHTRTHNTHSFSVSPPPLPHPPSPLNPATLSGVSIRAFTTLRELPDQVVLQV